MLTDRPLVKGAGELRKVCDVVLEKTNGQWFFFWLGQVLLLACLQKGQSYVFMLLLLIWMFRLLWTKDKAWLVLASLLFLLTSLNYFYQEKNYSYLSQGYHDQENICLDLKLDPHEISVKGSRGYGLAHSPRGKIFLSHLDKDKIQEMKKVSLIRVRVKGEWKGVKGPENFDSFDEQKFYKSQGLVGKLKVNELEVLGELLGLEAILKSWKWKIYDYIEQVPGSFLSILFQSFLLNDKSQLPEDFKRSFQQLGLMPFLALSGFHVEVIALQLRRLFYRLGITRKRTEQVVLALLLLYGSLVGWPISMVRAVGMHALSLLPIKSFTHFDRLALMGGVILLVKPFQLHSLSYILSFAMTLILILLEENPLRLDPHAYWKTLIHPCFLSILTLFLTGQFFFRVNILLMVWSALFAVAFSYALLPLLIFASFYGLLDNRLWGIYSIVDRWLLIFFDQIKKIADWPYAYWVMGKLPLCIDLLFLTVILFFLVYWGKNRVRLSSFMSFFCLSFLLLNYNHWSLKASMIMLNVHQGDAFLAYTPAKRKTVLIDTGGVLAYKGGSGEGALSYEELNRRHANRYLLPALFREGISRLDILILTHPDADHIGGALSVMETLAVRELWISKGSEGDPNYRAILDKAKEKAVLVRLLSSGQEVNLAGLDIKVLSPDRFYQEKNEQSIVSRFSYKGLRCLLMGDAGVEVENNLIQKGQAGAVDILKVGHHGSNSSSSQAFVDAIHPKEAWISVGENNRYGHPKQEVLEVLKKANCRIRQTAKEGAVRIDWFAGMGPIISNSRDR